MRIYKSAAALAVAVAIAGTAAALFLPSSTAAREAEAPTYTANADKPAESVIKTPVFVNEPAESVVEAPEPVVVEHSVEQDDPPAWDDVTELARLIYGEAGGIPSIMERAAVVWCVLNRVDDPRWPDTVEAVTTQQRQFLGYSPDFPATDENKAIAADVLMRWELEKIGAGDAGRVLPAEYVFFTGDGRHNHFTAIYNGGNAWAWTSRNPYKN